MAEVEHKCDFQKAPHISPPWASYGMSIVSISEKIDSIITTPHYTTKRELWSYFWVVL